jgi:Phosphopantetheine attachment site
VNFDDRALAVLDVLAGALRVDLGGARPDTPLQAFSVDPADWIVILSALEAAFPGSTAGLTDAEAERCVTLGDLVERVEVAS